MIRPPRPSPFSQAVRSAMTDQQLVAGPQRLGAFKPQGSVVATPGGLPSLINFGPTPPGFSQSSRFTGGNAPTPFNPTHGEDLPTFQEPAFQAPQALGQAQGSSPLLAALSSRASLPPAATGATASGGGPGPGPSLPPSGPPQLSPLGGFNTPSNPGRAGGFATPAAPVQTAVLANAQNASPSYVPYQPASSALIAALAQQGQRLGTSRSAATFF